MLQVKNLRKAYGGRLLFDEMSFTLSKGERLGLCGRNGHGKTTLFRILLGEEEEDGGDVVRPRGYQIGCVRQQLNFTEATPLQEACKGLPVGQEDATYKVEKILCGLGFREEQLHEPIESFSGGYHIRINLAKTLVAEPDLLLLDEPTNYLDIVSIRWLIRFLRQWRGELMLITHDRAFMDAVTTHTMVIHRQKAKKVEGGTEKLYGQILAEEEIHEKTRVNQERKQKQLGRFVDRFRSKNTKAKQVQSKLKLMARMPVLEELAALHNLNFHFPSSPFPAKQMLEIKKLSFGYDEPLIKQLSFTLEKGERLAVIGKNGRGKSTLLRLLAGELTAQTGEMKVHPQLSIGYFGQTNIERLDPKHSVEEEIASASRELDVTSVRGICGTMLFEGEQAKKKVAVLSGGERSRVLLGKLLAKPANLLLLDEPTNHLDMESIESLVDSLEDYDGGVILVTHSELILSRLATKIIYFREGNAHLFLGSYEEFLEKIGWQEDEEEKPVVEKVSRKEQRRLDAEKRQEQAKQVKPIKRRMEKVESSIVKLESELEQNNAALIEASAAQEGAKISDLSKSIADAQAKVDNLYEELQELTERLEQLQD